MVWFPPPPPPPHPRAVVPSAKEPVRRRLMTNATVLARDPPAMPGTLAYRGIVEVLGQEADRNDRLAFLRLYYDFHELYKVGHRLRGDAQLPRVTVVSHVVRVARGWGWNARPGRAVCRCRRPACTGVDCPARSETLLAGAVAGRGAALGRCAGACPGQMWVRQNLHAAALPKGIGVRTGGPARTPAPDMYFSADDTFELMRCLEDLLSAPGATADRLADRTERARASDRPCVWRHAHPRQTTTARRADVRRGPSPGASVDFEPVHLALARNLARALVTDES